MALVHQIIPVGPFVANCHVLADDATKTGVIIDPGDEPDAILEVVRDLGIRVTHLLHTHCHLDHISGTRKVKEETGGRILIHGDDKGLYDRLKVQYRQLLPLFGMRMPEAEEPLPVDERMQDGAKIPLGTLSLEVMATPGHTPGSCGFRLDTAKEKLLFTGDTLFARSIGRTDLEGGDMDQELESIRTRLLTLDADTRVFPGHGPETRIGVERRQNPFLQA